MIKPITAIAAKLVRQVVFRGYDVRELETGAIEVLKNGVSVTPVRPILRDLALALNVGLLNQNGNPHNTRQLGTLIIKSVNELSATDDTVTGPESE
jgi:hypothetical protein